MINKKNKIYVAGHTGLVGSAIVRVLKKRGYNNLLLVKRNKLNLTNQKEVIFFLRKHKPKFIFIAAAKVGGIYSNKNFKADFIYQNLQIQNNLIHGSYLAGIKNLIFLGSSCVYPKNCKQPIKEEYLLSGKLENTNDAYAIAKIAGIKMCQSYNEQYKTNFRCLMPTNTFGPNDNYNDLTSHFFPALIKKIHKINNDQNKNKILKIWGDGSPKREVIHVDDLAEACIFFMNKKTNHFLINIGTGRDFTIKYYVKLFLKIISKEKKVLIKFDKTKPNGVKKKVLDITLAKKYGWKPKKSLRDSIIETYKSYINQEVK